MNGSIVDSIYILFLCILLVFYSKPNLMLEVTPELEGQEHLEILQRSRVWFLALIWSLQPSATLVIEDTTSSSRVTGSGTPPTHTTYTHSCN